MDIEVTKRIEFSCCYIQNHQIESHHCKLEVTVSGPQRFQDFGRIITYEDLQRLLRKVVPDKSFLFKVDDEASSQVADAFTSAGCKTQSYNFDISAENLCKYFAETLQEVLNIVEPGIVIHNMKFREDNNSYVSWSQEIM